MRSPARIAPRPAAARAAGVLEEEPTVVGRVEQHPLADPWCPLAGCGRPVGDRAPPRGLVTPGVIAEERAGAAVEHDPLAPDLDPPGRGAGDLVRGPLRQQPAVEAAHLDRSHVRGVGAVTGDVEPDSDGVVVEHQAHGFQRLDDLEPQGPGAELFHVGAEPARDAHVVLPTLVSEADEAVEHVVVGVQPDVRRECHRPGLIGGADVVTVVPTRVAAGNGGERVGDLMERVLVGAQQHALSLTPHQSVREVCDCLTILSPYPVRRRDGNDDSRLRW